MEPKVLSATECYNESKKRFQTDLELLEAVKQIMANLCGLKFEKGGKKLVGYVVKMLNRWQDRICYTTPKKRFQNVLKLLAVKQNQNKPMCLEI